MSKHNWNQLMFNRFCELAMLTEEEKEVLETRIQGWTITRQSIELKMSVSKVNRIINSLKDKYDSVQKYDDLLIPRKSSAEEDYMDTH